MSYAQVKRRIADEKLLFTVLLELTFRCNLDCFICYNDLSARGRPMRLDDYRRLLDDLAEMQAMVVSLSGGEPLAHPDFFAIGAAARERGFVVRVKSNGHALRGELARRLKDEVDPFIVEISLHGATAATHDRQTRVAGSFDQLLANLEGLREIGIRFKLNAPLTCWNESEIEGMYAIADSFDVPLSFDPVLTPRDDGDRSPMNVSASPKGLLRLYSIQVARSSGPASPERPMIDEEALPPPANHCGAGLMNVAVDPYGNVYPCVAWRVSAGNLHEQSIRAIWEKSQVLPEVRNGTAAAKVMLEREGPIGKYMAFCPGLAVEMTGRPDGVTETQRERARLAKDTLGG